MSQQDLTKCLHRYFKQPSIDHKDVSKLISFIQDFANKSSQPQMIQKIFRVAEMSMTKDNLKVITKRYLYIINQILERDDQLEPQLKYRQAVSNEIVHQYITILRNVLNYGPTDLLSDIKLFRKRWAKRINDQAYSSLQTQALKQLKFDMDKGFSEEIVKKLTKSYHKRQFSKAELQKYLPSTNNQMSSEVRKSSTVSSSSSQREGQPRKKLKSEEFVAEKRNQSSDMVMPRHSFIPSNSNTYGNGPTGDPRRPNQIMYPSYPNIYPSPLPQYPVSSRVINSAIGQKANYIGGQQTFFQPTPYNGFTYPNFNYGPGFQNYPNVAFDYQRNDAFTLQLPPKLSKLILRMEKVKKCWSFECKSCGVLISTNQKYDEHMLEHFQGGQKQYEIEHSRTDHSRKANKSLLSSLQQWIQSNRVRLADQKFQVAIEGDMSGSEVCCICKGDLNVSWSNQLDNWVFEDAIRTRNKDNRKSICHSECYHTIDEFEKSSDEFGQ